MLSERDNLVNQSFQSAKQLDQSLLAISSAALGLSITFVKQITPVPIEPWLLMASWVGFVTTILVTLIGLYIFRFVVDRQIDIVEEQYLHEIEESNSPTPGENKYGNWVEILTPVSCVCFLLSWLFLIIFAFINLE